jgi:hypothetical protein
VQAVAAGTCNRSSPNRRATTQHLQAAKRWACADDRVLQLGGVRLRTASHTIESLAQPLALLITRVTNTRLGAAPVPHYHSYRRERDQRGARTAACCPRAGRGQHKPPLQQQTNHGVVNCLCSYLFVLAQNLESRYSLLTCFKLLPGALQLDFGASATMPPKHRAERSAVSSSSPATVVGGSVATSQSLEPCTVESR